jgi:hypothetical protein
MTKEFRLLNGIFTTERTEATEGLAVVIRLTVEALKRVRRRGCHAPLRRGSVSRGEPRMTRRRSKITNGGYRRRQE